MTWLERANPGIRVAGISHHFDTFRAANHPEVIDLEWEWRAREMQDGVRREGYAIVYPSLRIKFGADDMRTMRVDVRAFILPASDGRAP